ncbi:MAG: DUF3667 domain-containing protein [Bacteroidota bacterium]
MSINSLFRNWSRKQRHHLEIFVLTTRHLITQPRTVVEAYWAGKRKTYYNPFNYFVLIGSIMAFSIIQFSNFDPDIANQITMERYEEMGIDVKNQSFSSSNASTNWVRKNMNIILMLLVPFYALSLRVLLRKRSHNLAELIIVVLYAIGLYTFLSIPMVFFMDYNDPFTNPVYYVSLVLMFAFLAWILGHTFKLPWWRGFFLAAGMYFLSFLTIMVIALVVGIIVGISAAIIGSMLN